MFSRISLKLSTKLEKNLNFFKIFNYFRQLQVNNIRHGYVTDKFGSKHNIVGIETVTHIDINTKIDIVIDINIDIHIDIDINTDIDIEIDINPDFDINININTDIDIDITIKTDMDIDIAYINV